METTPKWRKFEELAAEIQRQLAPNAQVTTNERLPGRRSNTVRQIDICVRKRVGQYDLLVVIDCKDYGRPVDLKELESFIGLVADLGANKGAMVSAQGFTSSAKKRAEDSGIDLYRLVDAEAHEWQSYVAIPVLIKDIRLDAFSLTFSGSGPMRIQIQDFRMMPVFRENGEMIDCIGNLVIDRWEDDSIPKAPGQHEGIALTGGDTWVKTDETLYKVTILVNARVTEHLRFGQLPLTKIKGFSDEIRGGVSTTGFTTDFLDFGKVEQEWKRINSEEELAVKPVFTLGVISHYPRLPLKGEANQGHSR